MAHPLSRWFAALAGVALLAFAIQGQADSRENLGAGDSIRVTVFQNPDLTTETRTSRRATYMLHLTAEVRSPGRPPPEAAVKLPSQWSKGTTSGNRKRGSPVPRV